MALELERTQQRNKRLRLDLVAGTVKAPNSYYEDNSDNGLSKKEILMADSAQALLHSQSKRASRKAVVEAESSDKEADMAVAKQMEEEVDIRDKLDLLKLTHGITILYPTNKSAEDGDRMNVLYFPNVLGQMSGPFKLGLRKEGNKWVCANNNVPLPTSIVDIPKEFSKLESDKEGALADLLGKIATLLRALLSRKEQFRMLTEELPSDVLVEPKASEPDYRVITFGLRTLMEEDEEGSGSGQVVTYSA